MKTSLCIAFFIVLSSSSFAQCDSLAQVQAADDTLFAVTSDSTYDPTKYILPNEISPFYTFDLQEDSVRFKYRVGEFALNSRWVYLETWCHDKQYNFDVQGDSARWDYTNAELSNISRTKTFALAPSDTVSFYREYFWLDKTTNSYNTSKFVSSNSISVVVELVNAENGLRLTLLDSMHIASTGSNQPCVVSWKPAIARIARQATSIEDTVSAYMQVRVATGGSNAGTFMRYDMLRTSFSKTHLADAGWQDYARNVAEDNNCSQSCTFLAEPLANPRGIQVSIAPGQTAVDALTIFDINGNVLNTTTLPTSSPYTVSVTSSGVYVVVGFKAGSPICTVVTYVQ